LEHLLVEVMVALRELMVLLQILTLVVEVEEQGLAVQELLSLKYLLDKINLQSSLTHQHGLFQRV
jgi:hypothetical protein